MIWKLGTITYLTESMGLKVWTFIKKTIIESKMECEAVSDFL